MDLFKNQGSIDVGGDNSGLVVNTNTGSGSAVNVTINHQVAIKELPSYLGKFIVYFSQQELEEYAKGRRREIPPEVLTKVQYNNLDAECQPLKIYTRFADILEHSYTGVEKRNADARYLVRLRAANVYASALSEACNSASVPLSDKHEFARTCSEVLLRTVIAKLLEEYKQSDDDKVEHEVAFVAISLIVADAFVECEVLERPKDAIAA